MAQENKTPGLNPKKTEEVRRIMAEHRAEHAQKMETDPEYRKLSEEVSRFFEKHSLGNDTIED